MAAERGDAIVAEWLAGGQRNSTIGALRVLFNDAMSVKAGRLLARNPFAGLGIAKTKGNKDKTPPNIQQMETLLQHARPHPAVIRRLPGVRMRLRHPAR